MSGGLMQLVAIGQQDAYLTENPTITYWKRVYQRHTNFAVESVEQSTGGTINFGNKMQITISRNGDLLNKAYLEVKLPEGIAADSYVPYVGHAMIKSIEMSIGNQRIDKHSGEWLHLWYQLACKNKEGYEKMIGKKVEEEGQTIYIPLCFWWNRTPGMALPLIALQYHEVKITVEFNHFKDIVVDASSLTTPSSINASLYTDFIYIDTDERKRFAQTPHEYLIDQVQEGVSETVNGSSSHRYSLNFNHPCKEIVWTIRPPENTKFEFGKRKALTDQNSDGNLDNDDHVMVVYDDETAYQTFEHAKLQLNGHDRFSERDARYFNLVQPYQHHTNVPNAGVYSYSFALEPESEQPSGSCNMSRIDKADLIITKPEAGEIMVYATNFNILRIMGGMGGIAYAN
jgi:hypothetical protein